MNRVGVGKEQPFSERFAGSGGYGIVLTRPAGGKGADVNHPHSGKRCGNFSRAVRRMVIYNKNLECSAALGYKRLEARSNAHFLIACGDDHRDLWMSWPGFVFAFEHKETCNANPPRSADI